MTDRELSAHASPDLHVCCTSTRASPAVPTDRGDDGPSEEELRVFARTWKWLGHVEGDSGGWKMEDVVGEDGRRQQPGRFRVSAGGMPHEGFGHKKWTSTRTCGHLVCIFGSLRSSSIQWGWKRDMQAGSRGQYIGLAECPSPPVRAPPCAEASREHLPLRGWLTGQGPKGAAFASEEGEGGWGGPCNEGNLVG